MKGCEPLMFKSRLKKIKRLLLIIIKHKGNDNKILFRQVFEIAWLWWKGKLSPFQYYIYGLSKKSFEDIKEIDYLGSPAYLKIQNKMNHSDWNCITTNKWAFYLHMHYFGLPVPGIYGFYDCISGSTSEGKGLRNANELKDLLESINEPDFVIKPIKGEKGKDVLILKRRTEAYSFESLDGRVFSVQELSGFMSSKPFIIQEKVKQHSFLADLNPYTLNTFRIVTLKDIHGTPHIHYACFRMGMKGSNTDNTHAGGIFVYLNQLTGELGKGAIKDGESYLSAHPDSGKVFTGKVIPSWREICNLSLKAAKICPLGSVGWDIALSQEGPVLIEGNDRWAFLRLQMFKPYLTQEIVNQLNDYGIR